MKQRRCIPRLMQRCAKATVKLQLWEGKSGPNTHAMALDAGECPASRPGRFFTRREHSSRYPEDRRAGWAPERVSKCSRRFSVVFSPLLSYHFNFVRDFQANSSIVYPTDMPHFLIFQLLGINCVSTYLPGYLSEEKYDASSSLIIVNN